MAWAVQTAWLSAFLATAAWGIRGEVDESGGPKMTVKLRTGGFQQKEIDWLPSSLSTCWEDDKMAKMAECIQEACKEAWTKKNRSPAEVAISGPQKKYQVFVSRGNSGLGRNNNEDTLAMWFTPQEGKIQARVIFIIATY
ncbi:unnamed protein product [Durusdinium trenchii]|uniref:Uncharacterized protein n=1 Tax=Durusdinium trenchii TaxID=1381693 RepID=A0ABP0KFY5_9DINO